MTTIRPQYHFRQSEDGRTLIWNVKTLIERSQPLQPEWVPLSEIKELDECYWFDLVDSQPTCRNIVEHMQLINEVDLDYPILLCHEGRIMDGMHRVCKALMLEKKEILAMRFKESIPPDFIDVDADNLDY